MWKLTICLTKNLADCFCRISALTALTFVGYLHLLQRQVKPYGYWMWMWMCNINASYLFPKIKILLFHLFLFFGYFHWDA